MDREVVFEYLDNGERKSIHFALDENGMLILRKCLTKYGRYVNKNSRTIFFIESGEAQEVAKLIENEIESIPTFSFNPQIMELMKDRECWFIAEKELVKVKRAV